MTPVEEPPDRVEVALPTAWNVVAVVRGRLRVPLDRVVTGTSDLPGIAVALAAMIPDDQTARQLLDWWNPPPAEVGPCRVETAIPAALALAGAVRDRDPAAVAGCLDSHDLLGLVVACAALVPFDRQPVHLLAWWSELRRREHAAARQRDRRARNGRKPRKRAPRGACGTPGGVQRHRKVGEPVCEACRAVLAPCGTRSAYVRHRLWHEPPCEPCTTAHREYERARVAARRAAARTATLAA